MPVELVTQSEVGRRTGRCDAVVTKAVASGALIPDFIAGRTKLFRASRLEQIGTILSSNRRAS
jgi:hypothetical protein